MSDINNTGLSDQEALDRLGMNITQAVYRLKLIIDNLGDGLDVSTVNFTPGQKDAINSGITETILTNLINKKVGLSNDVQGILSIANGGTNASTASEARVNLSVPSIEDFNSHKNDKDNPHAVNITQAASKGGILPVENGGTNANNAFDARKNLWVADKEHTHKFDEVNGILSVEAGGTGADNANQARNNLEAAALSHSHSMEDIISGVLSVANGGTGNTSGYIESASRLAIPRLINGIAFDGTNDIIITDTTKAPINHASEDTRYGMSSETRYGHARATFEEPSPPGDEAEIGTDNGLYARGDHAHPIQWDIPGNARSATQLVNSVNIKVDLTSTDDIEFNGSGDVYPGINGILSISHGGTDADNPTDARENLGAADKVHTHTTADIISGIIAIINGGTGMTSNPSMLINLASTTAVSIFTASPRPGVTGILPITNGGTGLDTAPSLLTNLASTTAASPLNTSPRPGVTGVLPPSNGGTGQNTLALARNAMGLGNTTGALPVENGGTAITSDPSLLINLASTTAAGIFQTSPRPGVTGILPVANGGTGQNTLALARNAMGLGNTTGVLPQANGGTGYSTLAAALAALPNI